MSESQNLKVMMAVLIYMRLSGKALSICTTRVHSERKKIEV
jgi:hypothetical protein